MNKEQQIDELKQSWSKDPRWSGIERPYGAEEVVRLRGSLLVEHTLAKVGSERLWNLLQSEPYVNTLGALTGNMAVQHVQAGLKAIYLSGWQVAGDANSAGQMYPDQSLYPVDSVPTVVRRINNALTRADQVATLEGRNDVYWHAPIVADAEAGFGGVLNAYELMKAMIEAGASGVHFEDQLASEKKCGHLGGKVLVPTSEFTRKLNAARLAADVLNVPALLMARTDAQAAQLLTSDVDPRDQAFITSPERTPEGFYRVKGAWRAPLPAGWPTRLTPICYGARPPLRTLEKPASLRKPSTRSSPERCSPTTALPLSTGESSWTSSLSRLSSRSWERWATNSSSSPWPASTR